MKLGGHSRTRNRGLRINGKPVSIGLGSFPDITLAEAVPGTIKELQHYLDCAERLADQVKRRVLEGERLRTRRRSIRSSRSTRAGARSAKRAGRWSWGCRSA